MRGNALEVFSGIDMRSLFHRDGYEIFGILLDIHGWLNPPEIKPESWLENRPPRGFSQKKETTSCIGDVLLLRLIVERYLVLASRFVSRYKYCTQLSSVQNRSIIPLNPGWVIGIPLLDYYNPQYIGLYNPLQSSTNRGFEPCSIVQTMFSRCQKHLLRCWRADLWWPNRQKAHISPKSTRRCEHFHAFPQHLRSHEQNWKYAGMLFEISGDI